MQIQELRELKQYILDKYIKTKDKDLKPLKRVLDKMIKKKLEEGC